MDDWLFLLETVRKSWTDAGKPSRVTCAVSGGADSVALLRLLCALRVQEGFSLSAAHVDHGLRAASGQDAEFVRAMCEALGVPCKIFRLHLTGRSEEAAREARYEALRDACASFSSGVLALAHHRRDQAETLLLHLFRGSGGGGLSAMAERSLRSWPDGTRLLLWRPLLTVSPDMLSRALREQGVPWREDETNAGDEYLRNYIRHQVLPAVTRRMPKAEQAMGRAAYVLADEADYFRQEARSFLARPENARLQDPCRWVRVSPLRALHTALQRHVLRLSCPAALDWETTLALAALAPGRKMNLPEGWRACCTREYLHFLPPDSLRPSPASLSLDMLSIQPANGVRGDGKRVQAIPRAVFDQCVLRYGQPGDVIRPLGGPGTKSMQDYFVDRKLDQPFRRHVPLLCVGKSVVWAIGVGPGEEARVSPGEDALLLRWGEQLPFYLPNDQAPSS